jgi:anti-sigma B factor antagonist
VSLFTVRSEIEGDVATLYLEGELDLSSAPQAEAAVKDLESNEALRMLVLDLRGLRFLDSTGLRVILATDSRARRTGRQVRLVPGPEAVHRVFRIALLDRRLDFVDADEADPGAAEGNAP